MGSTGRRRPSRGRPSGEPTRRPPFGAPRQPWWGNQEWWHDKQTQHRLIDEPTKYGFLDEPDQHRFLTESTRPGFPDEPDQRRFRDEPARRRLRNAPAQGWFRNAAIWRRWFEAATRHPWYTGLGAGAGFMVLASGVIFILPKSPSAMMTQCGVVPCTSPHAGGRAANPSATHGTTYRFSRAAKARPAASTLPATVPSAMGSAAPQLPPSVTVTYALIVRWYGGVMGEFTIANHGSAAITGWKLSAAFPGDQIQVTWGPIDPNPGGYTVVMEAQPDWLTIAPGASQSGYFIARGNTATPSSCTFNGTACAY